MRERRRISADDGYDVLAKWSSMSFDAATRAVLARRLAAPPPRRFFSAAQFDVLEAACARLVATARGRPPIANAIDDDLHAGRGEGFRAPGAPRDGVVWRIGLDALDAESRQRHDGRGFAALDGDAQDSMLHALQRGDVDARSFAPLEPCRFFTDVLLKTVAGHFYSRPEAWSEIGFGGPASPRGYVRIGIDQRDPWEAPLARRQRA